MRPEDVNISLLAALAVVFLIVYIGSIEADRAELVKTAKSGAIRGAIGGGIIAGAPGALCGGIIWALASGVLMIT
jgi:hypothetical protein